MGIAISVCGPRTSDIKFGTLAMQMFNSTNMSLLI